MFVTLGYSKEIKKNDTIIYNKKKINFYENVSLVALKNGIHSENGYIYLPKENGLGMEYDEQKIESQKIL